ncbi:serine/threonine protein kinase, partial [Mycobacterium intracellulare]|uniref:serine/threonine protein kinase n=1 Tax=Mycobacterium intracellulare TaxID=1767 RepID=UPI000AEC76B0
EREAFIKRLRRDRDPRARKRFRREAVAYATLTDLGLPRLIEDNSETWDDGRTPMYLATEYVPGGTLQAFIDQGGQADVNAALACVRKLGEVLDRCHENGVTHRDIKPANVVLRNGDITDPVLVDLGLSFNDADEDDDLTRAGEEVGNRFLRLPEHSSGGRDAVSDVTQLAGIFFYILTGREPRVLIDESGQMPHQRPEPRSALADLLGRRQYIRVTSCLDRAFAIQQSMRYTQALDLVSDLERAVATDEEGDDDLEGMIARVKEIVQSQVDPGQAARREALRHLMIAIDRVVQNFASSTPGLQRTQTNWHQGHGDEEYVENFLAVVVEGDQPDYATYRVEPRANEFVALVDGVEVWRGELADQPLTDAITRAVAKKFLSTQPS